MGFWGKAKGNRQPPGELVKGFNPAFAMRLLFTEHFTQGEMPDFGILFIEAWTAGGMPDFGILFTETYSW